MYVGVVAILVYFMVVPGLCELGAYLYNRNGGKKD